MPESTSILPADAVAAAINDGKKHLLLAATGSVATIKLPNIISALSNHTNLSIRVILTKSAANFLSGQAPEQPTVASLASLPHVDGIYQDEDETGTTWTRGRGILHINLRKWAHILVVAPLSANTLAKIANGISDSLLTDLIRAWDTTGLADGQPHKRIVVCLAMNVAMWLHPVTAKQIRVLEEEWGVQEEEDRVEKTDPLASEGWFEVVRPIEKSLACGDVGIGGMREWTDVVKIIEQRMGL
ncbi:hypothetical protein K4F52_001144 [Lecanicillium sp. MT-2017a]|nr:hypothetical protein K4F52_001144 [Lecanicillium sp. MT-2017a]